MSQFGWQLMALHSAQAAGIEGAYALVHIDLGNIELATKLRELELGILKSR